MVDYCFQLILAFNCWFQLPHLFRTKTLKVHSWTLIYFLAPNYRFKNLPTIMLRLCFCLALQFSQVLEDPGGRAYLHKYVDPALNGDYPVDSMWKVRSCDVSNSNLSHGSMPVNSARTDLFCSPKAHHPAFEITQRRPDLWALAWTYYCSRTVSACVLQPYIFQNLNLHSQREQDRNVLIFSKLVDINSHCVLDIQSNCFLTTLAALQIAQLAGRCTKSTPDMRPTMRGAVLQLMTLASTTQEWEVDYPGRN